MPKPKRHKSGIIVRTAAKLPRVRYVIRISSPQLLDKRVKGTTLAKRKRLADGSVTSEKLLHLAHEKKDVRLFLRTLYADSEEEMRLKIKGEFGKFENTQRDGFAVSVQKYIGLVKRGIKSRAGGQIDGGVSSAVRMRSIPNDLKYPHQRLQSEFVQMLGELRKQEFHLYQAWSEAKPVSDFDAGKVTAEKLKRAMRHKDRMQEEEAFSGEAAKILVHVKAHWVKRYIRKHHYVKRYHVAAYEYERETKLER